jgi:hypothetical protein
MLRVNLVVLFVLVSLPVKGVRVLDMTGVIVMRKLRSEEVNEEKGVITIDIKTRKEENEWNQEEDSMTTMTTIDTIDEDHQIGTGAIKTLERIVRETRGRQRLVKVNHQNGREVLARN